ncbi:Vps53-like protein [Thelephora terrestris]|uniref:Vps53-like protein n=1 Tax=Thelephora terrestris TaxID=56493 RepID=A0A9P6LD03_9AGAM|nr:Vps53-like protein [Thelephora terrestris]
MSRQNAPGPELPLEVILSLQRILDLPRGHDAEILDGQLDTVSHLNKLFPTEASLGELEAVQQRLAGDERQLKAQIDELTEELKANQDPNRMQLIQEMISELLGQMSRIQEKASESEAIVKNITKDIQILDLAKKNLMLSMTSLQRLQSLVNEIAQLESLIRNNKYHDIVHAYGAVKQLSLTFKPYIAVPTIAQVWRQVQDIQGELRTKVDADFDAFYLQTSSPARTLPPETVNSICLIADALGPDVRLQMVERYVGSELKEYRRIFRPSDEAGGLDNVGRRFAWFRRVLSRHEAEMENDKDGKRVFPDDWKVGWAMFSKFSEITREDLTVVLSKVAPTLTVQQLLDTLQPTMEFEASMSRKWSTPVIELLTRGSPSDPRPSKPITSAFEHHMNIFVEAQDRALADMLTSHRNGLKARGSLEARPSFDAPNSGKEEDSPSLIVHPSSTELFYFIGHNLEQCANLGRTGTGKALFDLLGVHKKWLKVYAEDVLLASMKKPVVQFQPRRSTENPFDSTHVNSACLAINTADYCQTTAMELEEKIREKIIDEYKEKISLSEEFDLFTNVISVAIVALLKELETAFDPPCLAIARTAWSQLNLVSGPSNNVIDLIQAVENVVQAVRDHIERPKYTRNFLDKAASLILAKFTHALVKSRPLKETGAEQLIIDLQALKACLLKLSGGDTAVSASYTKTINKNTQRLESLLKVIVTPADPPEGFILNYTLLIGDDSFSNFQKILDLKGTPKVEENELLDSFLTITSTKPELEKASFLTLLDMDPSASNIAATTSSPGGSRVSLPSLVAQVSSSGGGDNIFSALTSPPPVEKDPNGKPEPSSEKKREVFSDFRRFVSFAVRRERSEKAE